MMNFAPLIAANEELKIVATYDRATASVEEIPGFAGGFLYQKLNIAGLPNPSIISVDFNSRLIDNAGPEGNEALGLSTETYTVTSQGEPGELNSLIWAGLYTQKLLPGGITPPSIQQFTVIGSSGIFSGINRVVVDYNSLLRVCYFIGPRVM